MTLADASTICKSALWERITGWEVVAAVLLITTAWAVVQVARMYYITEAAKNCPHCKPPE